MRKHASKENDRCRGHNQRESPKEYEGKSYANQPQKHLILSWSSLNTTFKYWKCNNLSKQLIINAPIFVNVNKVQSLERPRKHLPQRQRWHLGRSRANWSSTFMQGLICNRCQGMMPPCSIFLDPCEQQNRHFRNRLKVSTHN